MDQILPVRYTRHVIRSMQLSVDQLTSQLPFYHKAEVHCICHLKPLITISIHVESRHSAHARKRCQSGMRAEIHPRLRCLP